MNPNEITIIIKTFERIKSLKRLLDSILKFYPKIPIIICDDSKKNIKNKLEYYYKNINIKYIHIAFDSGLSKGRNVLLQNVNTPYFVLCDDDFVFDKRTDINNAFECLIKYNLDIIGGDFYNYITITSLKRFLKLLFFDFEKIIWFISNRYVLSRYIGTFEEKNKGLEFWISNHNSSHEPYFCDAVNNFFIAKTTAVKKIGGWNEELKVGEHEDFFLRAKKMKLKIAYLNGFGVRHYPVINSNYKKYRYRSFAFKKRFVEIHGYDWYKEITEWNNEVIFEFKKDV